jgi:ribosome-binding factor A
MHIRTVPEFTFLMDTRAEYGEKIDKILNEIHKNGNEDENA